VSPTLAPAIEFSDIVDPTRVPVLWMLIAFVVTALLTRGITRHIRAGEGKADPVSVADPHADPYAASTGADAPLPDPGAKEGGGGLIKNVHIGGVHVHHQVWGILLALVIGLLLIAYQPHGLALNIMAAVFGAGAALALDEFAMWLHVEDVYWSHEGRKSISAMMTAAAICLVLILGSDPLDISSGNDAASAWAVVIVVAVNLLFVVITILKGKLPMALIGIFMPFIALIGAWRVAKPTSWWARRRYTPGSRKDLRSRRRFDEAYERKWERIKDLIGGAPTPAEDSAPTPPKH